MSGRAGRAHVLVPARDIEGFLRCPRSGVAGCSFAPSVTFMRASCVSVSVSWRLRSARSCSTRCITELSMSAHGGD